MDGDSTSFNIKTSEMFKRNYKFIDFKKSSNESSSSAAAASSAATNESASEFYLSLISDENLSSTCNNEQTRSKVTKTDSLGVSSIHKPCNVQFSSKDLFRAAQSNDLNYIKTYVDNGLDVSVLDDYRWNILMISIAAQCNKVVDYLLNDLNSPELTEKLMKNKDQSRNDSAKLAARFKNEIAAKLIKKYESDKLVKAEPKDEEDDNESVSEFYCESCQTEFNLSDQTHLEHVTSIVHQLNETEKDRELTKKRFTNYHLRSNNKGYQIMLKSGWKESSGLGSNEQGRVNPVRAKQKLDRLGIGIEKEKRSDKKDRSSLLPMIDKSKKNIFKLKSSNKPGDDQSLKDYKKSKTRNERLERNLRQYFNS